MNANFPIFCSPLPAGVFSILAPYFSFQTVQYIALSRYLVKQNIGLGVGTTVADPYPGAVTFLNPRIRDGKKSRSGSGMNIPDHISESIETIFLG
jgi:hypothetical protein